MSLNSSEEDSDHLSKLKEQNGEEYEMQQKKLKIAENEKASRPKKHKKERLRKLRKMGMTKKIGTITKRWISSIFLKKIHIFGTYSIRITANMMLGR